MTEEWKWIPGYEQLYQVSNFGRVKSYVRPRIMKQTQVESGHVIVRLTKESVGKNAFVHRLVALAFIPNPDNHKIVLHWDDNPLNNHVENLRWGTRADNLRDAVRNKGGMWERNPRKGTDVPSSVLNPEIVRYLREQHGVKPLKVLSEEVGVSMTTISLIQRRKAWKHVE